MRWAGPFAELVHIRQSDRQLAQYAAVAAGVRRALDDWIPIARVESFRGFTSRLGLVTEIDCTFEPVDDLPSVPGAQYAPTTHARAARYEEHLGPTDPGARVHVIVSSRADWAADAWAAAWYSVVVNGRVLRKPLIDHLRMGRALGYPSCCVDFFIRHNDWARQNTLAEAAHRTSTFRWETNCLTKFTPWMLSFHMPCAFDCPFTIRYARDVLAAVQSWDPDLAEAIVQRMRRPCFALSERFGCALEGGREISRGRYAYTLAEDLCVDAPTRTTDDRRRAELLIEGDELRVEEGAVTICRRGQMIGAFDAKADESIAEVPMFLPFE